MAVLRHGGEDGQHLSNLQDSLDETLEANRHERTGVSVCGQVSHHLAADRAGVIEGAA
jgi:hypothetical protein